MISNKKNINEVYNILKSENSNKILLLFLFNYDNIFLIKLENQDMSQKETSQMRHWA